MVAVFLVAPPLGGVTDGAIDGDSDGSSERLRTDGWKKGSGQKSEEDESMRWRVRRECDREGLEKGSI